MLIAFIAIIIGGIFLGLILAFVLAPIMVVANKKKLKEMDKKIEEFERTKYSSIEEKENAKRILKKELIAIKAKIVADKKSTEQAQDKIAIL